MSENEKLREIITFLERARADEQAQRDRSERIVDALLRFSERGSPEQIYATISDGFRQVLAAQEALLLGLEASQTAPLIHATKPSLQTAIVRVGSTFQRILRRGKPTAFFDATQVPEWAEQAEAVRADTASMLVVPLAGDDFTLLLLLLHGQRAYFTDDHAGLARRLIAPAKQAIAHALFEDAERQLRSTIEKQRDQLQAEIEERARLETELRQTRESILRAELAQKAAIIEHQNDAIRALATPIIEVWAGILCLPVIGFLDTERGQQMSATLLAAVQDYRASGVIIDITGITQIDSHSLGHFLRMAAAVRLLGTRCAITGISAHMATQLVETGASSAGLSTYPRVRDALQHLLRAAGQSAAGRR